MTGVQTCALPISDTCPAADFNTEEDQKYVYQIISVLCSVCDIGGDDLSGDHYGAADSCGRDPGADRGSAGCVEGRQHGGDRGALLRSGLSLRDGSYVFDPVKPALPCAECFHFLYNYYTKIL